MKGSARRAPRAERGGLAGREGALANRASDEVPLPRTQPELLQTETANQ